MTDCWSKIHTKELQILEEEEKKFFGLHPDSLFPACFIERRVALKSNRGFNPTVVVRFERASLFASWLDF